MEKCHICNKELSSIPNHLHLYHNIEPKDYYDKYIKKETEGLCIVCNTPTQYDSFSIGYKKYCSKKCNLEYLKTNRKPKPKTYKNVFNYQILSRAPYKKRLITDNDLSKFICALCGYEAKNFNSLSKHIQNNHKNISYKEYYDLYISKNINVGYCEICGNETKFRGFNEGYRKTCSKECDYELRVRNRDYVEIGKKISQTKQNKTQEENDEIKRRRHDTNLEKYGDPYYHNKEKASETRINKPEEEKQKSKDKFKNTCLERYGVENVFQSEEVKKIMKETKLEKYGDENYTNWPKRSKTKKDNRIAKLTEFITRELTSVSIIDISNSLSWKMKCNHCNKEFEITEQTFFNRWKAFGSDRFCTICYPRLRTGSSIQETELRNFIKTVYNGEVSEKAKKKIIGLHELDIWLPELRLAFEFNGTFWHSTACRDENYHFWKTSKCENHNVELIHIYECDWMNKRDFIERKIKNIFETTSFSSNYEICTIDNLEMLKFIEENTIKNFFDFDR